MTMPTGAVSNATPLRPLVRQVAQKLQPLPNNEVSGSARIALDVLLPTTTAIVADQVLKSSLKSGKAQAIVLSFVASAATHALSEGAVQVVKNTIDGLPWDHRLGIRALRGAQGGLFIAAGNLVGPAIQGGIAKRFNKMNPVLLVGVANATAAVSGTVVRLAADPDTWENGAGAGLKRIGITSAINAGTAMVAGSGIRGLATIPPVGRVFQKLPYPFSG
jgi:hypothetical protein